MQPLPDGLQINRVIHIIFLKNSSIFIFLLLQTSITLRIDGCELQGSSEKQIVNAN